MNRARSSLFANLSLVSGMLILLSASFAQKPSFDCAAAGTPSEHLICADTNLATREQEMASTYVKVLKQSPLEQKAKFRQEQHQWFRDYSRKCNASMTDDERRGCITGSMIGRTKQLQSKLQGQLSDPQIPISQSDTSLIKTCLVDAGIGATVAVAVAVILDMMGLSGVATVLTLKLVGGGLLEGCLNGVLHQVFK